MRGETILEVLSRFFKELFCRHDYRADPQTDGDMCAVFCKKCDKTFIIKIEKDY